MRVGSFNSMFTVEGRIVRAMPARAGFTGRGSETWKVKEYVLRTFGRYPREIFFYFADWTMETYLLEEGDEVFLNFDIESREYHGRWYTRIRGLGAQFISGAPMRVPGESARRALYLDMSSLSPDEIASMP